MLSISGARARPDAGPVPTLREQQKLFTRQRLVHAAVDVFRRDGYVAARIEDIATAAGASRATFYLHYRSKPDIVRELMAPLRMESEALYRELDSLDEPTWDELYQWMDRAVDYWHRNHAAISAVDQAVAVEPEIAADFVSAVQDSADAMTNHLARWSGAEQETARLRSSMFIFQLERFCFFWVIRGLPFDREAALTALTDSFWTALHPGLLADRARPHHTLDPTVADPEGRSGCAATTRL